MSELRATTPLSEYRPNRYSGTTSSFRENNSSQSLDPKFLQLIAAAVTQKMNRRPGNAAVLAGQVSIRCNGRSFASFDGLVDTGAAMSVIPRIVVEALQLQPVRRQNLSAFDGPSRGYDLYRVELAIPDVKPRVVDVPAADRLDVLVGRDILENCRITYDGPNKKCSIYEPTIIGRIYGFISFRINRIRDWVLRRP